MAKTALASADNATESTINASKTNTFQVLLNVTMVIFAVCFIISWAIFFLKVEF